jgi:hypothetical protein
VPGPDDLDLRKVAEITEQQVDDLCERLPESNDQFAALVAWIGEIKAEQGIEDNVELVQRVEHDRAAIDRLIARRRARKAHEARKQRPCQVRARPRVSRPRERRERRHVARSTSSADPGDPPSRSAATRTVVA